MPATRIQVRKRDGTIVTVTDDYVLRAGEAFIVPYSFVANGSVDVRFTDNRRFTDDVTDSMRLRTGNGRDGVLRFSDGTSVVTKRVHDGRGRPAGHRPGFLFINDSALPRNLALEDAAEREY